MWLLKWVLISIFILISPLLILIGWYHFFFLEDEPKFPVGVVGMAEVAKASNIPPYTGPHPSALVRPAETFEFPIRIGEVGPVEPLFAGELQYPFLCGVRRSGLGQPIIDNFQEQGIPVYRLDRYGNLTQQVLGYSKDCLIPTQARYYYNRKGTRKFYPLAQARNDISQIDVNGKLVDFIVRVEIGVINRFFYTIAAIKGENEDPAYPATDNWNGKLIYQFRGGVGIGYRQGRISPGIIFSRRYEQLAQGYAVVYSSGTQTSNHYNLWRSEEVALRVKRQFIGLYGEPEYTVGIGGSGGAIQQLILAQNNPGIIDAAIAEYAYPDMVTQIPYAMDCELLEYYFDVVDADNPRWRQWSNRQVIEGLNASDNQVSRTRWFTRLSQIREGVWPNMRKGDSECVNGWRGLIALVNNPQYTHLKKYYDDAVVEETRWTHWNDLKGIYGTDAEGYGKPLWDNTGVQYGLLALREGKITVQEFLELNASIGGWKSPQKLRDERYWFYDAGLFPIRVSVWSHGNMTTGSLQEPAQRVEGNIHSMRAAYHSGHVFMGHLPIPVIDLRHYLEQELDMHHLSASFAIRQRFLNGQGHSDNHLIWVTQKPHNGEAEAFALLDQWLRLGKKAVPELAQDKCFDQHGNILASGEDVWNGLWNDAPEGDCHRIYPAYNTSRQQAGEGVAGDLFKCHLQPIDSAMDSGLYGQVDMTPYLGDLQRIFPIGVCDYQKGDMGRPKNVLANSRLLNEKESSQRLAKHP